MSPAATVAQLRPIDLFDELDDAALEAWAQATEIHDVAAGEVIVDQGDPAAGFQLVLEGVVQAFVVESDGRLEPVGAHVAPTWMGAIAVLTESPVGVRMQAETDCVVGILGDDDFIRLTLASPSVHRRIMRQVRPVVSRITAMEQNRERLASLGTMAAGLAHELNNPAAAARRAAAELADALKVISQTLGRFVESGIERSEAQELVILQREALDRAAERGPLGALDAADAEDELLEALEELGVPEPWTLTEPLAAAGVDRAWLERVAQLAGPATDAALAWVAASLAARGLAAELSDSAQRMSNLVGAVKSYAYMDRGELNEVDVHEGLESTLILLGHKLKHTSIEVRREYDRDLPALTAHGSELNQVWTNLLDNAIDALGEHGTITITTRRDGPCVVVDVADDGAGIPEDVRDRIFDPFFTTKDVGAGTGLGLDTARRIVQERHHGTLAVDSESGRTVFHVWLPAETPAAS
jgi:signal transduction histidine kinase